MFVGLLLLFWWAQPVFFDDYQEPAWEIFIAWLFGIAGLAALVLAVFNLVRGKARKTP